ncbi:methyl-CPG-binding domain protein 5 [Perilla frutescens var. hirtella]|uniref:Methyl-CPG-binding domain protein 5 n=1 Tax=Perilla frutescens var. hirtella TaxID=608512 RepID=A0AAD4JNZ7_PERFH|nr:methyl-CPG-binding domain protein 5 [Perilla frutescens var. hirtella]
MSHDPDATPTDPLLETGSYIDPGRNDPATAAAAAAELPHHQPDGNPEFAPGTVIAAEPISMYVPGEDSAEATPRAVRRRNPDEMLKRPSWLPEDWTIDLRVRSSGATAGLIDRYYVEPSGHRKFRSKIEVLHYLETGSKPKRKSSETDTTVTFCEPCKPKSKEVQNETQEIRWCKTTTCSQRRPGRKRPTDVSCVDGKAELEHDGAYHFSETSN